MVRSKNHFGDHGEANEGDNRSLVSNIQCDRGFESSAERFASALEGVAENTPASGSRSESRTFNMPFKSKAQRRKFAQLLVDGKISDETYEEWNRSTGTKELPERVVRKAAPKKATRKPARATKKRH
jgi:hypothetical protein